ncbi:MAG: DUF2933 domain-containing protein [Pseudonocardiales bacterium]|nr:DUF2933 domain-containing protein [Pseudonocardiales bacterium]
MSSVSNYLYLLLVLACPLMMIFMMRGMHGGPDMGAEDKRPLNDAQAVQVDLNADHRIMELERQVAQLRAERDRIESAARRR